MDAKETLREFYRERSMHKRAIARAQRERFEALLPRIVRDIDLALESTDFLKVSGWLLSLPEAIDVVDYNQLYPHIRDRVDTRGRVLYERRA
jgi:hypothetical protein